MFLSPELNLVLCVGTKTHHFIRARIVEPKIPTQIPKTEKNCLLIGSTRLPVLAVRVFQFRRRAMSTHKHTNGLVEKRFRGKSIKKIVKKQIDRKGKGTKLRLHETLWFGCARNATKTQL